ncbi:hypothetical protein WJ45_30385 [Burkholderia ubonensis]|nr:hypothetical protein WJ45_30385 [Burkholderia ubonensis]KVQ49619.1 hypothetical protein WK04_06050 [Burkholderia ubonensis]
MLFIEIPSIVQSSQQGIEFVARSFEVASIIEICLGSTYGSFCYIGGGKMPLPDRDDLAAGRQGKLRSLSMCHSSFCLDVPFHFDASK